jgi:tetratricopeptide (TPR) repeat protein
VGPAASAGPRASIIDALRSAEEQRAGGRLRAAVTTLDEAAGGALGPSEWVEIGNAYARLAALQRADGAYARAEGLEGQKAVRAEVLLLRRQRGLFGVAPVDEPEANAALETAYRAFSARNFGQTRTHVDTGLKRWPSLSGLLAIRCGVELNEGNDRAARTSCARALAVSDETLMALYFDGILKANAGKRAEAIRDFERGIALDPDQAAMYEQMAPLLRGAKLDALREAYRERFKRELKR